MKALSFFSKLVPLPIKKQLKVFYYISVKYVQYQTIRNHNCVNQENKEIPWYTYPAIEFLNGIDFSTKRVFEFGSGNSSLYWARVAREVLSIEHDEQWYNTVKAKVVSNLSIHHLGAKADYINAINQFDGLFDIIIIDGKFRDLCSKNISKKLTSDGMVILDNSDWHHETAKYLRESLNLIQIDFHGFGPINEYTWTTSILLSRQVILQSLDNIQPHYSVCALRNDVEYV